MIKALALIDMHRWLDRNETIKFLFLLTLVAVVTATMHTVITHPIPTMPFIFLVVYITLTRVYYIESSKWK